MEGLCRLLLLISLRKCQVPDCHLYTGPDLRLRSLQAENCERFTVGIGGTFHLKMSSLLLSAQQWEH